MNDSTVSCGSIMLSKRRIFVYNIYLISIIDTDSDGATKNISSEYWQGTAQLTV